jgi:hypothetical protein
MNNAVGLRERDNNALNLSDMELIIVQEEK